MKNKAYNLILLCLFLVFSSPIFAGWVIVEKKTSPQGLITHDTIYVQNNKMRSGGVEGTYIYDLNKNEITVINNFFKTYWTGTPEEYRKGVINGLKEEIDAMVARLPKEKQESARKQYEAMLIVFDNSDGDTSKDFPVSSKKIVDRTQVMGYDTQRYDIFMKGEKKITIWVSDKVNISKDFDIDKFGAFMRKMMNNNAKLSIKSSVEYTNLMKKGYPLKTIEYVGKNEIKGEVVSANNIKLSENLFKPSPGFRAITLEELIKSMRPKKSKKS